MNMDECCGTEKKEGTCNDDYCEMSGQMVCLGDKAWSCLMMDKMKAAWEKERGTTMNKVADVVVKHNMAIWAHRMQVQDMKASLPKEAVDAFKEELGKAFQG